MWVALNRRVPELQIGCMGFRGFGLGPLGLAVREKPRGGTFCHDLGLSSTPQRGDMRKVGLLLAILHILDARGHNSTKATQTNQTWV